MFFKKKEKILVTGGAGFIGSHLVDALIAKGHGVVVVDDLSSGNKKNINPRAKFYKYDIRDERLARIFQKYIITHVFHTAAQINLRESIKDPLFDARINILGALNLLENCGRYGIKKFIFSSTGGAIYGDAKTVPTPETYCAQPISPYGVAKQTVENYLHYYHTVWGLDYIALRYANVYGPRQNSQSEAGVIAIFCDQLLQGKQSQINGDGKQTRDFVYVSDVVAANLLALKSKISGVYNVGTGVETNVNELYKMIAENIVAKPGKANHAEAIKGEQRRSCLNNKKIRKDLGWQPKMSVAKGIKLTVNWFKVN